jgi:transposase
MYIARVPNRNSPPAILLRESYREGGKVKNRTIANLSRWSNEKISALAAALKGEAFSLGKDSFEIARSQPHGHIAAALGTLRKLGLDRLIDPRPSRERSLCLAMIVARIVDPSSKLATARGLSEATLSSSLGSTLAVQDATEDELYEAMDWLLERQTRISTALAKRHIEDGALVLYDVTSTYFEGRSCVLGRHGHSRDGRPDKLQIVFGLMTDEKGRPVSVEVFEGNTGDPKTLSSQVEKMRRDLSVGQVVVVGDRGMVTTARIREDLKPAGLDWITALRAPAIQKLAEQGALDRSLFDDRDLAEIFSPDYPGERLIACRNPLLAAERARNRQDLLSATEKELEKIAVATSRPKRPLRGKDKIALRVGRILGRYRMAKHFRLEITDSEFRFEKDVARIEREALLDGFYVIRTNVSEQELTAEKTVESYKRLSSVERAFRSLKTVDLKVRPIYHHLAERVRAHVFLCMLAYYVEWHMRDRLAPIIFDDDDSVTAASLRSSPVEPAPRSPRAQAKAVTRMTEDGQPVHSFRTLLRDLATLTKNRIQPKIANSESFEMFARPTEIQQRAFNLLKVSCRM